MGVWAAHFGAVAALAVAPALLGFAASARADEAAMAEARMGALTLAYDPAEWQVDGGNDEHVIACIAEACDGVVLEVTVAADPTGFCDKDEVRATADFLFAFADRHPTNIYPLGELALVMAQSRNGSALDAPNAVFACLTRDGWTYRFRSRAGEQPFSPYTGGIVLGLLGGLSAPPADIEDIRIGEVLFSYAADVWHTFSAEAAVGPTVLHCLPPTCFDLGPRVLIRAGEGAEDCFAEAAAEAYWPHEDWPREIVAGAPGAELLFRVHAFWTGCRNGTPPHLLACAAHDGVTYRVEAPVFGCRTGPDGVPLEAFLDLVESARLVP